MEILEYREEYKTGCLAVLKSNIGQYIAEWELEEYMQFLEKEAGIEPYFVIVNGDDVLACGGFCVTPKKVVLTWGLVKNSHHGQGIGTLLLCYRLQRIQEEFSALPIQLDTSQKTQGFSAKYGFEPTEVIPNGYMQGLDKVYIAHGNS